MGGGSVEAGVGGLEGGGAGCVEALVEGLEAVAVIGYAEGDVLAAKAGFQVGEASGVGAEGAVEGGVGAVGEVVKVLGTALEGSAGAAEDGVCVEGGEAVVEAEEVVAVGACEAGL